MRPRLVDTIVWLAVVGLVAAAICGASAFVAWTHGESMDRIECVTVCVDYADFLREVAPINRAVLDRWIVVTEPGDKATREVCRDFSIECLLTGDFRRGGEFAKARGINRGLDQCQGDGWLLHLDADIALPFDFGRCLEKAALEPGKLYGCDRLCVTGWDNWAALKARGLHAREHGWLVEKRRPGAWVGGVPAGPDNGYAPIGFFQLWHGSETLSWGFPRKRYPERHGNAARTDVQFAWQWDRPDRVFLPELVVFHLESDDARMGANWRGRTTAPFGPAPAGAAARQGGY